MWDCDPLQAREADREFAILLEEGENEPAPAMQSFLNQLRMGLERVSEIEDTERRISTVASEDPLCLKLRQTPGVGPIVATALIAAVDNAAQFRRARDMAAWIGPVPRQYSTVGHPRLLGISKRDSGIAKRNTPEIPNELLDKLLEGRDPHCARFQRPHRRSEEETGRADAQRRAGRALTREAEAGTSNHRNGSGDKTALTPEGELEQSIPRDRRVRFVPALICKYCRRFPGLNDKIIALMPAA